MGDVVGVEDEDEDNIEDDDIDRDDNDKDADDASLGMTANDDNKWNDCECVADDADSEVVDVIKNDNNVDDDKCGVDDGDNNIDWRELLVSMDVSDILVPEERETKWER